MISPGIYSTSQLVVHLNEASASLGNLKTCLCASGGSKAIKSRHNKLASVLSSFPKAKSHNKQTSVFPLDPLPSGWLEHVNIPNTKVMGRKYLWNSPAWKASYISAESFLLNKHGMFLPLESRWTPLYSQRMMGNRKLFIQNIQQKRWNSSYMSGKRIVFLEEIANQQVNNPEAQAEYLKSLVNEDPEYVIRRCESGRYASNEEIKDIYMKALLLTNQLNVSEAQRRISTNKSGTFNNVGGSNGAGSENQPLHVVMANKKGSFFREQFWNTVRFGILVGIILYGLTYMQTKMLNVSQKDILPDQSEKKFKFTDVQGCNEAKEELEEVVQFLRNPEKFEKLGAKLPCGVLLIGPPGTGKTLLARAIAGEADVPFFFVSGSEFDEMFVGVGAARVRKLFAAAKEHSPCIIFIDELDAIGGTRIANDHQPYSRMTLNQLLVELDGFDQSEGIIVIGATNFPEILDKALTRPGRFDSKVHVTMPDVRGRIDILKLYLSKSNCTEDIDVEVLARGTPGFSGADLSNLVNQAALRAASLQLPTITMEHFEWARDKIMMGPERRSAVIEQQNRILVAYHESGHATVAIFTKDAQPVHKATVMPRGSALGYVMQLPEKDELNWSRKQLLAKMDVCMGGRVAEEMIFGEDSITTGASSDMEQASKIARAMVTKYGMSDKVGTVLIDEREDKLSPELQNLIESEVKRFIQEAYMRAKNILKTYSKEHKRLAEGLLKYETLDSKEIDLVIKGLPLENK